VDFQRKLIGRRRLIVTDGSVIGHCLVFVETQKTSVGAYEPFIEDAPGKRIEILSFKGFQMAARDLGRLGDLVQSDAPHFPLTPQPFSKCAHG
jgi:hypothetical protein